MQAESSAGCHDTFWHSLASLSPFANEADVEHRLITPLLAALGYERQDIVSKVPVTFTRGTKKGRPFEADFVTYAGALHNRDTSLMVIEAKAPGEPLQGAQEQAESYAVALKAPVFLLTNGERLQVWQVQRSRENEMLFDAQVVDLAGQRSGLEHLISRVALIKHVQALDIKQLPASVSFTGYKRAELSRDEPPAIARRLSNEGGGTVLSTSLLASCPQGALIRAPSGYGKTVLARQLVRQALEDGQDNPSCISVVELALFDFAQSQCEVLTFIHQRIKARQPEVSLSQVGDSIRLHGVTLVCDGLEYLAEAMRSTVESQLRLFRRNYPEARLFIFSRVSVPPHLELPHLALEKLNHQEQREMIMSLLGRPFPGFGMPQFLSGLSEVPLLLARIIDFFKARNTFPDRLEDLFEHWLIQLDEGFTRTPADRLNFNEAMQVIAISSSQRRLAGREALRMITDAGLSRDDFNALINAGVIVNTGRSSVGFVHDALADYLHARGVTERPYADFAERLEALDIQPDSLLPAMLISLAPNPAFQQRVWAKLEKLTLSQYINVARICQSSGERQGDDVMAFLGETLTGIDAMLDRYFPSIKATLRPHLAYVPVAIDDIAIHGDIDRTELNRLSYKITPAAIVSERVKQSPPCDKRMVYHANLARTRLNINGGRYAAALHVKSALGDMVRQRTFRGGVLLANERSLSRLRYMASFGRMEVTPRSSLSELLTWLEPIANRIVLARRPDGIAFSIRALIDDLTSLQQAGHQQLDEWWLPHWNDEDRMFEQPEQVKAYLAFHFSRATDLYHEVVNASFGSVASELFYLNVMPFRREVLIFGEPDERTINWRWVPVQSRDEAQTVCWFEHELPGGVYDSPEKRKQVGDELIRLKRSVGGMYTSGAGGRFPSPNPFYEGRQITFETPTLTEAASMIESDINSLFWHLLN